MVLSVLSNLVIWVAVAVTGLRLFQNAGGSVAQNKVTGWLLGKRRINASVEEANGKEVIGVFINALLFRLFFFGISVLVLYLFTRQEFESFDHMLRMMERWDATNYVRIATEGYAG